jgi:spermidine synthase
MNEVKQEAARRHLELVLLPTADAIKALHIPLLAMDSPERVLVRGFGVGNTAHAATLHTSVSRVDIADLSPHSLEHAGYFRDH